MRRLSPGDIVTAAASTLVILSLFLPWFGYGTGAASGTFNGFKIHTFLVFGLLDAVLLVTYLLARAGWDRLPVEPPLAHDRRLLVLATIQFLLVLVGVTAAPSGASRQFGSGLCLLAALTALLPAAIPAARAWQKQR